MTGRAKGAGRGYNAARMSLARLLRAVLPVVVLLPALALAKDRGELTILSYHEIADKADALTPAYAVTPTNFLRQMDWLRNHGYRFVGIDDVLASRAGKKPLPEKAVLVTFDDAYQSVYVHAWPVLKMFRIPAVVSVVGSWLDQKELVDVDGKQQPRKVMISWEALREMRQSGLVEVGSHSWDLHRGILANPQGNLQPAATNRRWIPEQKRHEDESSYRRRIEADLSRSVAEIRKHTGKAPRVITWPYGRYNATTAAIAERLGFQVGLTLLDGANGPDTPLLALRRLIVDGELTLPAFAKELEEREEDVSDEDRPQSIAHVDLDAIYDADPAQQERNLSHLLDRLQWLNVNTVYLQAFADPDANGSADAVYFPSRRLPMRADLFNRVAWQIRTRTQVRRLYAWFPALAFELPPGDPAAKDVVTALPAGAGGDRRPGGHGLQATLAVLAPRPPGHPRDLRGPRPLGQLRRAPLPRRPDPLGPRGREPARPRDLPQLGPARLGGGDPRERRPGRALDHLQDQRARRLRHGARRPSSAGSSPRSSRPATSTPRSCSSRARRRGTRRRSTTRWPATTSPPSWPCRTWRTRPIRAPSTGTSSPR